MNNTVAAFLHAGATGVLTVILAGGALAKEPLTRSNGAPVGDNQNSQTAGPQGPGLLQDNHLIEKLAHFDRERIPERVVHARGAGAHGVFKATENLSEITRAAPFAAAGKETEVFVRFSAVIHSKHSPETLRDPRGFSVKFYTEQGNWDLVGNNFPVFFIRDAIKFPDMIHSLKPNPVDNVQSAGRFLDFFSHVPESTHTLTYLFSPLGIPTSYREMNGSGVHAFKFVDAECNTQYVKFTWESQQGNNGMSGAEAAKIQATNFNHLTKDLYKNLENGNFPVWDLYIQTLDPDRLGEFKFNVLDTTKVWPEELVPKRKVGELTLNRVPENFHQYTEQVAVAPSNMIPGIAPSEDRMLQGRLFSYADTQRYRLGINHMNLPVNRPKAEVRANKQEGAGFSGTRTGSVNYEPSRAKDSLKESPEFESCEYKMTGTSQTIPIEKQRNFHQAGVLYRSFSKSDQDKLVTDFGNTLAGVDDPVIQDTIVSFLYRADEEYGTRVAEQAGIDLEGVRAIIKEEKSGGQVSAR